ncbi:MAG: hypothetical protein A2Z25_16640 [Planctomycetes bacterium RBG_16_55_9]|nr:MAG: hypothetical protein A2Z25_16640 [Planctomycetes bacterium RBG_16_55_9]
MLRIREMDDSSRATVAQAVAPQTAIETPAANGPRLLERLRQAFAARWMGFRPVYTVCISRNWPTEKKLGTIWIERCYTNT